MGDSALINDITRGREGRGEESLRAMAGMGRLNFILKILHLKFRLSDSIIDFSKFGWWAWIVSENPGCWLLLR